LSLNSNICMNYVVSRMRAHRCIWREFSRNGGVDFGVARRVVA
jgi:hypothetical protein